MLRDLILGTAGHIDHGKTSLVKALTGVDCDRLPEEKARGITIDIGFANLEVAGFRLGIVDVPGHERFIKNMLAGATGIDLALLVVAADDSIMPQTREHLEILRLLGLRRGLIALTKCDLVDETTIEVVELEVRELVRDTFLQAAPIVRTSAHTGAGIEELKKTIAKMCEEFVSAQSSRAAALSSPPFFKGGEIQAPSGDASPSPGRGALSPDWFRLAIDRSFIVQGHGTIVTGSVTSGSVKVGDELEWLPRGDKVRIRSLQNHDHAVEEVHRGQRAALNLAGVAHEDIVRGQEVATPGYLVPSTVMTLRLLCLADMKRPIKHRASVRFHLGTAELMGTISLLDADAIEPGGWGLAQVFLEEPGTATWGQPFVIRGPSATQTLGGGQVLQPVAKKIRRKNPEVLQRLDTLWKEDAERALAVAWFAGFGGFTQADLVRGAGLNPSQASAFIDQAKTTGKLVDVPLGQAKHLLLHADMVKELDDRIVRALDRLHQEFPLMSTHDRRKVESQLDYIGNDVLVHAAVDRLIKNKVLVGDIRRIGNAKFKPKLSGNLRKLKDQIIESYKKAGFQPPDPSSFANQAGGNAGNLKDLFDVCVAEGELVAIDATIYLHSETDAKLRQLIRDKLAASPGLTVAEIRDLLGTTRKYAVPLCEYLDRIGLTKREGDVRVLGVG